jgi:outer membrane protein
MKLHVLSCFLFFITSLSLAADPIEQKTLEECFTAAIHQSETVATQSQLIVQAQEKYRQTIGGLFPNISGTATYLVQPSSSTNFFPTSQPLARITAVQPLFQGFREFAALRQNKDLIQAQSHAKWQASVQLYQDVSQNFYTLLSLERDLKNVQEELDLYQKRIVELQQFVNLGRSRQSEILTAQTQKESFQAQVEEIQIQINAQREIFHFLTGMNRNTKLVDQDQAPEKIPSLDSYLVEIKNRPDVRFAEANFKAAEEGISFARGAHFPTLNLVGNYYLVRFGPQKEVNWDAQLALSLPIFSGGSIQSEVRAAESRKDQSALALSRAKRLAEQEVSTFYHSLSGNRTLIETYRKITELAERNYKTQLTDYKHGLVTNLDVLLALTSFEENQRSLDRARFLVKMDYARIEAAVAHRPKFTDESAVP